MATTDQIQNLELSSRGILITPHTPLPNNEGFVDYNEDPNLVKFSEISNKGKAVLWYVSIGAHYSNYSNKEYIKVKNPVGGAATMDGCWKMITMDGNFGDKYTAYSILAATEAKNPIAIAMTANSVLARIGNEIKAVTLKSAIDADATDAEIATAKAVIDYVNSTLSGALSYKGGYNVEDDNWENR